MLSGDLVCRTNRQDRPCHLQRYASRLLPFHSAPHAPLGGNKEQHDGVGPYEPTRCNNGMNWQWVILGGLVVGMLINHIEFFLHGVFLAKGWQAAMMALNRPPIVESQTAVFFIWSFILLGAAICSTSNIAFADWWRVKNFISVFSLLIRCTSHALRRAGGGRAFRVRRHSSKACPCRLERFGTKAPYESPTTRTLPP